MTVPYDARDAAFAFAGSNDWTRAVPEARRALAADPEDASAHALLALGLAHQKEGRGAVEAAQRAVALEPEEPFTHYALGVASYQHDDVGGAERAAREALRLDPNADYYALLGQVLVRRRHWKEALQTAEEGLQLEPDHAGCASVRALALTGLGRNDEAEGVLRQSLAQDPDDAFSHAQRGWNLLRQSRADDALDAFRTALRLEPDNEYARTGMVEALKARYRLYRALLRFTLWMASLDGRTRWFVIIGLFVLSRIGRGVARTNPALAPFLGPVLTIYSAFVFTMWIAEPVTNLLLRLNRFGRMVLTPAEVMGSNVIGGLFLLAMLSVVIAVATGRVGWVTLAIIAVVLTIPFSGAYSTHGTRAWKPLIAMALFLAALGATSVALEFARADAGWPVFLATCLGVLFFQFGQNYLVAKYQ